MEKAEGEMAKIGKKVMSVLKIVTHQSFSQHKPMVPGKPTRMLTRPVDLPMTVSGDFEPGYKAP